MDLQTFYSVLVILLLMPGKGAAADVSLQESQFYNRLSSMAVDACPCATPEVKGHELILSSTWCLSACPSDTTPESLILGGVPSTPWLHVSRPREIHALAVRTGLIPDPRENRNLENAGWLGETSWWLAQEFFWPSQHDASDRILIFDGLSGAAAVWLNGNRLELERRGFTEFEADLHDVVRAERRNRLVIRFDPACGPEISPAAVSGPSIHWCGVEGDVRIVPRPDVRIDAVGARVTLATDFTTATVDLEIHVTKESPGARDIYTYATLRLPDIPGRVTRYNHWGRPEVLKQGENRYQLTIEKEEPLLWWPGGMEESHVYPLRVQIRELNTVFAERWVLLGIRTVDRRADGTLLINGKPVPIHATQWSYTDPFHPDSDSSLVEPFRRLFQSNLNALWVKRRGFESSFFYDACDTRGILVLQEIPQDCDRLNQQTVLNLELHPCVVGWTSCTDEREKTEETSDALRLFDRQRPVFRVSRDPEKDALIWTAPAAAPETATWEDLLDEGERWPPPPAWRLPDPSPYEARLNDQGEISNCTDYIRATQFVQADVLQTQIENTRIESTGFGAFIAGQLRALWPGVSPALIDALGRPTRGFWAVKRACEPAILSLRRSNNRFEAWIVNTGQEPVNGVLTVFDGFQPASDRRSAVPVDVPSGTASLVWSSTPQSWAEQAFREGDLSVLGAFAGEPLTFDRLARAAIPMLTFGDGTPVPGLSPQQKQTDARIPPERQAWLLCEPPARIAFPKADLHIITFAEDRGPWRITIRAFERKYLRNVRLTFDPPEAAWVSDQHFDVLPDSGRLVTIQAKDPQLNGFTVHVSADNAETVSFLLQPR